MKTTKTKLSSKIPKIPNNVISRKNSNGTVAVAKLDNDDVFFAIDGFAAEIWTLFDGKNSLDQILEQMMKKHNVPEQRFKKDVIKLIKDLQKLKLIRF